jgi:DNA polymerase-3 subunit chi
MTVKVEFHSGVPDKLAHACRFLRKAHAAGARVAVCGDGPTLDRLDVALWTFDALSFVPHVRWRAGMTSRPGWERTPTWLVDDPAAAQGAPILVNLGPAMAPGWDRFERVIEIVEAAPEDSQAGRQRWRRYAEHGGAELVHHALGGARE